MGLARSNRAKLLIMVRQHPLCDAKAGFGEEVPDIRRSADSKSLRLTLNHISADTLHNCETAATRPKLPVGCFIERVAGVGRDSGVGVGPWRCRRRCGCRSSRKS